MANKNIALLTYMVLILCAGLIHGQDSASWKNKLNLGMSNEIYRLKHDKNLLASGEEHWVDAIMYLRDGSVTAADLGDAVNVLIKKDRFAVGKIDLNRIEEIASSPDILSIKSSSESILCDDHSITSIKARRVREKLGVTGKGAIVCLLDSGVDIHHPDFIDKDGNTRIIAFLDLTYPDFADESVDLSGFERPYGGVLVTEEQINKVLSGELELPEGLATDYCGHGTLCAGIAAANSWDAKSGFESFTEFGGIAPDARIVAIKNSSSLKGRFINTTKSLYGISFIDSLARARNMPYALNMSFVIGTSSHDGLSEELEYMAAVIQGANGRGKAYVAGAGNSRDRNNHATADLTPNEFSECNFFVDSDDTTSILIKIYFIRDHPGADLTVVAPNGDTLGVFLNGSKTDEPQPTNHGYLEVFNNHNGPLPVSDYRQIEVLVADAGAYSTLELDDTYKVTAGEWKLLLKSETAGTWHAYMNELNAEFTTHVSEANTVGDPAAREEVIAVGAYVSSNSIYSLSNPVSWIETSTKVSRGNICSFSSIGPTIAGVLKPEIAAPGKYITGTMSTAAWPLNEPNSMYLTQYDGGPLFYVAPDSIHGASSGTSFATPHVTGICALLFEVDPTLTHEEIKNILISTATSDTISAPVPNNIWGYGRANAVDAVAMALGISEENSPSVNFTTRTFPDSAEYADSVQVYLTADFANQYRQALKKLDFKLSWPDSLVNKPDFTICDKQIKGIDWSSDTLKMKDGEIGISAYSEFGIIDSDTLLAITLKPSSGNTAENISLGIENLSIEGDISPELDITSKVNINLPESFNLKAASDICLVAGDVNGSGGTDIFDLIELLGLLVSQPAEFPVCADMDSDSDVDIFDLLALLEML